MAMELPFRAFPQERQKPGETPRAVSSRVAPVPVGEDKNREKTCPVSGGKDRNREKNCPVSVGKDKNRDKPLAPDAKCLLRAMDAVAV